MTTTHVLLAAILSMANADTVVTVDGASLSLERRGGIGAPVLLVHGLSSNHHSFELQGRGLASDLVAEGYDVWMLDLRGRHGSTPPPKQTHWDLDDYGKFDVAAALEHIRTVTGRAEVAYVGHSMGGMVLSVYHHWHGDELLGPCVVLGSPLDFAHPDPLLQIGAHSLQSGRRFRRFPSRAAARTASILPRTPRADAMLFDSEATSRATRRVMYRTIVSPMNGGELAQIAASIRAGHLLSSDETVDYVASLNDWNTPLLVVAGRSDRIAPPDRVVTWLDATPPGSTEFWVAGRVRGYQSEYGHLDLILADKAGEELHRDVIRWLTSQSW